MSEQMISLFSAKVTELLMVLITSHFEDFSKDLLKKIQTKDINSIDDIRKLWNLKCKDNVMNINNTSIVSNKNTTEVTNNIDKNENKNNKKEKIEDNLCQVILNKGKNKGEIKSTTENYEVNGEYGIMKCDWYVVVDLRDWAE